VSKVTAINPKIVEYFQHVASQLPEVVVEAIADEWIALECAGTEGVDPNYDVKGLLW
jgi:hypothetical protein